MSKSKKIAIIVAVCLIVVGLIATIPAVIVSEFDFNKLNGIKIVSKTFDVEESFEKIDILSTECDIRIFPSEDESCKVICNQRDDQLSSVEVKDNTLAISQTDNRKWYEYLSFWRGDDISISIYLPKDEYQSLCIKTASGDVEIPGGFSFFEAELSSSSGDIAFQGNAKSLYVCSTSGDLSIKNAEADAMSTKSTSGGILLSNIGAQSLEAESTSGDIILKSAAIDGSLSAKSTSGDINLDSVDAKSLEMSSSSGDIIGSILSAKNFVADTNSGDIDIPTSDSSAGECIISTTSGNIKIKVLS